MLLHASYVCVICEKSACFKRGSRLVCRASSKRRASGVLWILRGVRLVYRWFQRDAGGVCKWCVMGVPLVCGVHGISDRCVCCVSQDVCLCYTTSLPRVILECVSGTLFWMMETRNKKVILVMNIPTPGKCSFTGR